MSQDPSTLMTLLKTIGALGIVLGFIFALSWFFKKYLRAGLVAAQQGGEIRVLQSFHFEPKKKLMIVSVNDRKLLLGVSENSISLLTSLEEEIPTTQEVRHVQKA